MANHHILSVLVENKFGVLTRVSSLFSRRGYAGTGRNDPSSTTAPSPIPASRSATPLIRVSAAR